MNNNDKICFDFTHKDVNTNKIKICIMKNIKYLLYYFFVNIFFIFLMQTLKYIYFFLNHIHFYVLRLFFI